MECPRIYNEIMARIVTISYDVTKNTRKFGKMFRVVVGVPMINSFLIANEQFKESGK